MTSQYGEPYGPPGYHSGYNEAILDGWTWNGNLPSTIEAFFMLEGAGVESMPDGGRGQASFARGAHSRFLQEYGLTEDEVPLLKFDPSRWDVPFRAEATTPLSIMTDRFHTNPYSEWAEDGSLAWSGLLVHCIDGYEDHNQPWKPEHPFMSASLLYADQRIGSSSMPLFTCLDGGYIFRPGATKVVCGNAGDSGGGCYAFCETPKEVGDVATFAFPGDGCGASWRPADFGTFLQRVSQWQKLNHRTDYNEIIVAGAGPKSFWSAHLPDTIEAFYHVKGVGDPGVIQQHHANFLREYPRLSAASHPLLTLDPDNWEHPLSIL